MKGINAFIMTSVRGRDAMIMVCARSRQALSARPARPRVIVWVGPLVLMGFLKERRRNAEALRRGIMEARAIRAATVLLRTVGCMERNSVG